MPKTRHTAKTISDIDAAKRLDKLQIPSFPKPPAHPIEKSSTIQLFDNALLQSNRQLLDRAARGTFWCAERERVPATNRKRDLLVAWHRARVENADVQELPRNFGDALMNH